MLSRDSIIPPLDFLAPRDSEDRAQLDLLKSAILDQVAAERTISEKVLREQSERPFPNPDTECKQPKQVLIL